VSARLSAWLCGAYVMLAAAAFAANWIPALGLIQAPSLQLGGLGLLLAAASAALRHFAKAVLFLAASAAFWIPVTPYLLTPGDKSAGAATIRLVLLQTSNAAAVGYVLESKPDIVVIADPSSLRRDRSSELAGAYPARLALSAAEGPIVLARQGIDLQSVPGVAVLDLLRVRVALGRSSLDLAVVHLGRPWPLGAASDPVAELAASLADEASRLVLVGDFNRPPWMQDMKRLQTSLGISTKLATGTWPAGLARPLRLPLDLVLVGRELTLRSVDTGPDLGSDHLPLVAEIGAE
jgi:endonuclease/exonuclease/phosphatase (EEP) superfamily protein YafD